MEHPFPNTNVQNVKRSLPLLTLVHWQQHRACWVCRQRHPNTGTGTSRNYSRIIPMCPHTSNETRRAYLGTVLSNMLMSAAGCCCSAPSCLRLLMLFLCTLHLTGGLPLPRVRDRLAKLVRVKRNKTNERTNEQHGTRTVWLRIDERADWTSAGTDRVRSACDMLACWDQHMRWYCISAWTMV